MPLSASEVASDLEREYAHTRCIRAGGPMGKHAGLRNSVTSPPNVVLSATQAPANVVLPPADQAAACVVASPVRMRRDWERQKGSRGWSACYYMLSTIYQQKPAEELMNYPLPKTAGAPSWRRLAPPPGNLGALKHPCTPAEVPPVDHSEMYSSVTLGLWL